MIELCFELQDTPREPCTNFNPEVVGQSVRFALEKTDSMVCR